MGSKPIIAVWATPYSDPTSPGYTVQAIAPDGVVVNRQVVRSRNLDLARKIMGVTGEAQYQREYLSEFPHGYELLWVDDPENSPAVVRAEIARERRRDIRFHTTPRTGIGYGRAALEHEMYCAATGDPFAWVYYCEKLNNYYLSFARAESGEVDLGLPFTTLKSAAYVACDETKGPS